MFTTHFQTNKDVPETNLGNLTYQEVAHDLCLNIRKTRDSGKGHRAGQEMPPKGKVDCLASEDFPLCLP